MWGPLPAQEIARHPSPSRHHSPSLVDPPPHHPPQSSPFMTSSLPAIPSPSSLPSSPPPSFPPSPLPVHPPIIPPRHPPTPPLSGSSSCSYTSLEERSHPVACAHGNNPGATPAFSPTAGVQATLSLSDPAMEPRRATHSPPPTHLELPLSQQSLAPPRPLRLGNIRSWLRKEGGGHEWAQ